MNECATSRTSRLATFRPGTIRFLSPIVMVAVLALTNPAANAALLGRDINGNPTATNTDPNAVFEYDTDLNLTWLRDWNYAQTSGFDADGRMTWVVALAWASGLTVGAFSGWRLPTTNTGPSSNCDSSVVPPGPPFPPQYFGLNCTGSEMGHAWYTELGNTGSFTNADPFANLVHGVGTNFYWSVTEYAPDTRNAWIFGTFFGDQAINDKDAALHAVAVRPGDVAGIAVPEPATLTLLGLGFAGLGFSRRKQ